MIKNVHIAGVNYKCFFIEINDIGADDIIIVSIKIVIKYCNILIFLNLSYNNNTIYEIYV